MREGDWEGGGDRLDPVVVLFLYELLIALSLYKRLKMVICVEWGRCICVKRGLLRSRCLIYSFYRVCNMLIVCISFVCVAISTRGSYGRRERVLGEGGSKGSMRSLILVWKKKHL